MLWVIFYVILGVVCLIIILFWVSPREIGKSILLIILAIIGFYDAYYYYNLQFNAEKIIFVGKVVNRQTNEWPNDRLVLVYLKGEEKGRAISSVGEFSENNLGVQDGLFTISISNTYRLTEDNFEIREGNEIQTGYYSEGIYTWLELEEGSQIAIDVPSKNLTYIIKSIAGDKSTLPSELLTSNSTRLTTDNEVLVPLSNHATNEPQNLVTANSPTIGNLQYTDIQTKTVILNKISHPVQNCVSSRLTTVFSDTRTIVHQYQVEAGGEMGAAVTLPIPVIQIQLFAALQAKYGFEQGQLETRTIAYRIEAEPHTNQVYDFIWKEVWESGTAETVNGEINVPFEVKTDLVYDVESRNLGCN